MNGADDSVTSAISIRSQLIYMYDPDIKNNWSVIMKISCSIVYEDNVIK